MFLREKINIKKFPWFLIADYSSMAQDDVKVKEQSRNSTPSPTDSTTFDPTLLSDTRPTGGTDPQPGTSHQSELIDIAIDIAARRGGKLGELLRSIN